MYALNSGQLLSLTTIYNLTVQSPLTQHKLRTLHTTDLHIEANIWL